MLFLWFLNNNGILYCPDGTKRLADNTLVALTLMIAEPTHEQEQSQTCLNYAAWEGGRRSQSKTEEKDVMVKVVVNLINQKNF